MTSDSEMPFRKGSEIVDAVIVGCGIAGLSAALFLARAGRSTIVYDAGRSRIFAVECVREFVGFDGWTPEEMMTKARGEALRYGAQIRIGIVTRIEVRSDGLFEVFAPDVTITARPVVLATGLIDELPPLKGLRKVWGGDLRYAHALMEMKYGTNASLYSACRNASHSWGDACFSNWKQSKAGKGDVSK